ncbi:hypothetical protein [Microbulbifer sp. MCCC 1A16149]|uniref:hypothetical protein n=1 Tax=Microbulbifer sp. MCCC 1A16149 TaxID=3411322 RepID=UPI003D0AC56E
MDLNWAVSESSDSLRPVAGNDSKYFVHHGSCEGSSEHEVQKAVEACIDKACDLLEQNIQDDSRYLLFEWNPKTSTLAIVVTDDGKERDSRDVVQCHFVANDIALNPDDIQFWIRDYLTTCTQFLHYSLIAAFHCDSRADCTLL